MKANKIAFENDFYDPFLMSAGTPNGNTYRTKRAIICLEQIDIEKSSKDKELKDENERLKRKLQNLIEESKKIDRVEERYLNLSTAYLETISQTENSNTSISLNSDL